MYIYLKDIRELKNKDKYQIQFVYTEEWSDIKIFNINMCRGKKEYVEYLIMQNRVRIIENE